MARAACLHIDNKLAAPLYDCTQFSSVCLVFDKESCLVNDDASLTEEECRDLFDAQSGFEGGMAQWCP